MLNRLFPFKRGLCHAYWAPNFWSIYNVIDIISSKIYYINSGNMTQSTKGIIQDFQHQILPNIRPSTTFLITGLAMLPCFFKILLSQPDRVEKKADFIQGIAICAATSFMFGWHVHEKAVLMVFIPIRLAILAYLNLQVTESSILLSFFLFQLITFIRHNQSKTNITSFDNFKLFSFATSFQSRFACNKIVIIIVIFFINCIQYTITICIALYI